MSEKENNDFNVDKLLNSLFPAATLNDLFEKRLKELNILPTNALEILDIEYRPLKNILNGTKKLADYTNFIKLAAFLKLPTERVMSLYLEALEKNFPNNNAYPQNKIDFINANFDLATLKKARFIDSITDYRQIEERINSHFGFKTIFEYKLPSKTVAFSAGLIQPKDIFTRGLWINSAIEAFKELANPYDYDRNALIEYFPNIRWQSINVEQGLLFVISDLFKLGVTVFYQETLSTLHLKGATMDVNDKPCIVLTNYKGFYSTLWHTLCHELSHVLFDFEEIKKDTYHLSEDEEEIQDLAVLEKEKEADHFAREYLFSKDKSLKAKPHINNKNFIYDFAAQNQVHPSFIYAYYAFDAGKGYDKNWIRANRHNPDFDSLLKLIENPWDKDKHRTTREHVENLKSISHIYN